STGYAVLTSLVPAVPPLIAGIAEAAATAARPARVFTRLGFVDAQGAAIHRVVVQCLDGLIRIGVTHLHKAETTKFTGFPVCDHGNMIDRSIPRKQITHL